MRSNLTAGLLLNGNGVVNEARERHPLNPRAESPAQNARHTENSGAKHKECAGLGCRSRSNAEGAKASVERLGATFIQ